LGLLGFVRASCVKNEPATAQSEVSGSEMTVVGQAAVKDDVSNPNIVQLAAGNADLSTLVTAVKAAGLTTSLSNAGPFTVFALLNSAFETLPARTVDGLLKPDQADALSYILRYHTYVGVIKEEYMSDGQTLGMVTGKNI